MRSEYSLTTVCALEEEDSARSVEVYQNSTRPIDIDHRATLAAALSGGAQCEEPVNLVADPDQATG